MLNYQRVSQSMASQSCWSLSVAGYCDGCRLGLRISQENLTFDGTNTGHILHSILYGSRMGKSTFGMSPQRSSRSWVGPMYGHMWSHGWTPCLFLPLLRYESAVFRVSHTTVYLPVPKLNFGKLTSICFDHRIGWWENLQESPIFDGKNHGFL
jgi:hypothetical protein